MQMSGVRLLSCAAVAARHTASDAPATTACIAAHQPQAPASSPASAGATTDATPGALFERVLPRLQFRSVSRLVLSQSRVELHALQMPRVRLLPSTSVTTGRATFTTAARAATAAVTPTVAASITSAAIATTTASSLATTTDATTTVLPSSGPRWTPTNAAAPTVKAAMPSSTLASTAWVTAAV